MRSWYREVDAVKELLSTYWLYIKTFFKSRAEYRVGFILGMFANFYCYFITFATYWVLVSVLGGIAGWNFEELSVLYGLSLLTYAISGTLVWNTVYHMGQTITTGRLDIYLTRPYGVLPQLIFQRFGDTFIGQIVVTVIFLVAAFINSAEMITWYKVVYLIIAIIGGTLIQVASMILIGSLSFWMHRSSEFGDIVYYQARSMTNYPLCIYPKWIQGILTFVLPWAFINYYPSLILLNKVESLFELALGFISPLVGVVMLLISLWVFKQGLKRYAGAGN